MKSIVDLIGLTADQIREAIPLREREPSAPPRYLYGDEQKQVISQIKANHRLIVAQALRSVPTSVIAAGQGVSRQCISGKLSGLGLTRRGRPPRKN